MTRIASIPANICMLEDYLSKVFYEHQLDQKIYGNVLISLTEAVNNAMIHGNKLDQNKFVHLQTFCRNHILCIRVSDEGDGFIPENVPDPTCKENIEKCGGRGVYLMQQLSDKVLYFNNGSTVQIEFSLE